MGDFLLQLLGCRLHGPLNSVSSFYEELTAEPAQRVKETQHRLQGSEEAKELWAVR
jgi:hypothetical protein